MCPLWGEGPAWWGDGSPVWPEGRGREEAICPPLVWAVDAEVYDLLPPRASLSSGPYLGTWGEMGNPEGSRGRGNFRFEGGLF